MKKSKSFITIFTILEILLCIVGISLSIILEPVYIGIAILILDVIMLIVVIVKHNQMVKFKNKIHESFALIDIQLKLRFDLIPNLVSVVKKYAKHEKEVLTEIINLRNQAVECKDEKEKVDYANKLVPQMKNLFAIAEGYPELKSNTLFKSLMEQLVDVEDRIAAARRIYDSNVSIYNTSIQVFPNNMLAKAFGFKKEQLFKIEVGENIVPSISMGDL